MSFPKRKFITEDHLSISSNENSYFSYSCKYCGKIVRTSKTPNVSRFKEHILSCNNASNDIKSSIEEMFTKRSPKSSPPLLEPETPLGIESLTSCDTRHSKKLKIEINIDEHFNEIQNENGVLSFTCKHCGKTMKNYKSKKPSLSKFKKHYLECQQPQTTEPQQMPFSGQTDLVLSAIPVAIPPLETETHDVVIVQQPISTSNSSQSQPLFKKTFVTEEYFNIVPSENEYISFICKYCNRTVRNAKTPNVSRLKQHILACYQINEDTKAEVGKCLSKRSNIIIPSPPKDYGLTFIKFMINNGIPFSTFESSPFKELIKMVKPSAEKHIPLSKISLIPCIDELFQETKTRVDRAIISTNSSYFTFITEGWRLDLPEHIVTMSLFDSSEKYLDFVYHNNPHSAIYTSSLSHQINKIGINKISAIVTDNTQNMKASLDNILHENSQILILDDVCHILDLILEDIAKAGSFLPMIEQSQSLIDFILNNPYIYVQFKKIQQSLNIVTSFSKPLRKRMFDFYHLLTILQINKQTLQTLFNQLQCLPAHIQEANLYSSFLEIVNSTEYWQNIHNFIKISEPIISSINYFSLHPYSSLVYPQFLKLREEMINVLTDLSVHLSETDSNHVMNCLNSRWISDYNDINIFWSTYIMAFFLDPFQLIEIKEIPSIFSNALQNIIHKLKIELSHEEFNNYWSKKGAFEPSFNSINDIDQSNPYLAKIAWWKAQIHHSAHLSEIAIHLLSIRPSSCRIERSFAFQSLYSSFNHLLNNETIHKAVFIYSNQKLAYNQDFNIDHLNTFLSEFEFSF